MAKHRKRRKSWKNALRLLLVAAGGFVVSSVLAVLLYRFVNPPFTTLMVLRSAESWWNGEDAGSERTWVPLERISPHLVRAVIASEDSRFTRHRGVDWEALRLALEHNLSRRRSLYGGSTITMQTVKNVFLWPSRSYLRKGVEIYFACLSDAIWGKRRQMEIYLNVVEWGRGVYGAEAAARRYFGKSASDLRPGEAALLAAVLPNPRRWSPGQPTRYILRRSATIEARMRGVRLGAGLG